ncbi:hypothetical protein [Terrisporobacter hibernicus]|uniref:Uncharacterized protein n=1 Tax=Terrisporobacter hibernicus TaxID=2813371 RepID=A0AAX2ZKU5_9FIRM|nr:hypothetical protein [Terrisporobacter hibernicus]UEL49175.1 hypothetical protein JW646_06940 [Terrisporobacter hibernicus]
MCYDFMEEYEKGWNMTDEEYEQWQDDMRDGISSDDERNWDENGDWIG